MSFLRNAFFLLATQGLLVSSAVQFFLYSLPIPGSPLSGYSGSSIGAASPNSLISPFSNFHFQVRNTHDGSYHFGYDAEQSYREEKRDAFGVVAGRYGYLDPNGIHRIVEYVADKNGYRANQFFMKPTPVVAVSQPAPAPPSPSPPPTSSIQVIGPIPKPISQYF